MGGGREETSASEMVPPALQSRKFERTTQVRTAQIPRLRRRRTMLFLFSTPFSEFSTGCGNPCGKLVLHCGKTHGKIPSAPAAYRKAFSENRFPPRLKTAFSRHFPDTRNRTVEKVCPAPCSLAVEKFLAARAVRRHTGVFPKNPQRTKSKAEPDRISRRRKKHSGSKTKQTFPQNPHPLLLRLLKT